MRKLFFFMMFILLVSSNLAGCSNSSESQSETILPADSPSNQVATKAPPKETDPPISINNASSASVKNTLIEDSKASLDWSKPSDGEYPILRKDEDIWIDVSIDKQRVFIKDGEQTLYTMITSSGLDTIPDNSTPQGTFYIEPERGLWFYSEAEQEGAKYFVSWKNHGEFLFHSVPMDKKGNVIEDEAAKLGQKASHGCFRLTIADAKWIYDNIRVKTKVVIHE
jgi:lipoprotein-anchoring transpeptidase ErfK/SrfK